MSKSGSFSFHAKHSFIWWYSVFSWNVPNVIPKASSDSICIQYLVIHVMAQKSFQTQQRTTYYVQYVYVMPGGGGSVTTYYVVCADLNKWWSRHLAFTSSAFFSLPSCQFWRLLYPLNTLYHCCYCYYNELCSLFILFAWMVLPCCHNLFDFCSSVSSLELLNGNSRNLVLLAIFIAIYGVICNVIIITICIPNIWVLRNLKKEHGNTCSGENGFMQVLYMYSKLMYFWAKGMNSRTFIIAYYV